MKTDGSAQCMESVKCKEHFYSLLLMSPPPNSNLKISFDEVLLFQRRNNITKLRVVKSKGFGGRKKRPLESILSLTSYDLN